MIESSAIRLLDRSSVAEARRSAVEHAARAGFDDPGRSDVAIVATELATNLLRHARGGVLSVSSRLQCADGKLLLVAVDQGPGIDDLDKCFADGYSSAGSSGTGLGAISRLSTCVDVYSTPKGTVLAAELMRAAHGSAGSRRVGGFTLAKEGQDANGDAWDCRTITAGLRCSSATAWDTAPSQAMRAGRPSIRFGMPNGAARRTCSRLSIARSTRRAAPRGP